jgi:hypothetical protein
MSPNEKNLISTVLSWIYWKFQLCEITLKSTNTFITRLLSLHEFIHKAYVLFSIVSHRVWYHQQRKLRGNWRVTKTACWVFEQAEIMLATEGKLPCVLWHSNYRTQNKSSCKTCFFKSDFKTHPSSRKTVKDNYLVSWTFSVPTIFWERDWLLTGLTSFWNK